MTPGRPPSRTRVAALAALSLATSLVAASPAAAFGTFGHRVDYDVRNGPESAAVGDFDRDGKHDLAVANANAGNVSVLEGRSDGRFRNPDTYDAGREACSVAVGDFDRDGRQDLAVANEHGDDVSVLIGKSDGEFKDQEKYSTHDNPRSVAVGDFDRDGRLDAVTANRQSRRLSILLGRGDGTFDGKEGSITGLRKSQSVATGDFNGDLRLDLVIGAAGRPGPGEPEPGVEEDSLVVKLGRGDGTFQDPVEYRLHESAGADVSIATHALQFAVAVAVRDLDSDGVQDLAATNAVSDDVAILLGEEDGSFADPRYEAVSDRPRWVTAKDFNDDGDADLAVPSIFAEEVTTLRGAGDGSFGKRKDYSAAKAPLFAVSADFNRDGGPDLAIVNRGKDSVSIRLNER